MAQKKKNNSRKALAVALGVIGIAGLSVASASQLTVTPSNEAQIGTNVFQSCDADGVTVDYAYNSTTFNLTTLTVAGIDAACSGEPIQYSLKNAAGTVLTSGAATVAGASSTFNITATIPVSTDLGDITVVIG